MGRLGVARAAAALLLASTLTTASSAGLRADAATATVDIARGLQMVTFRIDQGALYLRLPEDMAAGETIGGSFFHEPAGKTDDERARNAAAMNGLRVALEDRVRVPVTQPFSWTTPRSDSDDAKLVEITLEDSRGDDVVKTRITIQPAVLPSPAGQAADTTFTLPRFGQHGGRTVIIGPFDGRLETTEIRLSDAAVTPAAESPRRVIFFGPTSPTGMTSLVLTERTTTVRIAYRHVKVTLTAPKTNLQRGEKTTLTATVDGLDGLADEIPLYLEKFGVVRMDGGDTQVVRIAPGDVKAGQFTTTRAITGLERGSFIVNATVLYEPFDISIVDEITAQTLQVHSLTGDYTLCASGVRLTGRGSVRIEDRTVELTDPQSARRVEAKFTPGSRDAKASARLSNPNLSVAVTDRDSRNSPSTCQGK
jgi:hypothetical protein